MFSKTRAPNRESVGVVTFAVSENGVQRRSFEQTVSRTNLDCITPGAVRDDDEYKPVWPS
jgi:hypothetical protein